MSKSNLRIDAKPLTAERARELLAYNPETGLITWKFRTSNKINVGDIAGWLGKNGYFYLSIDDHKYLTHRIAWLIYYGAWPKGHLDHRNHKPTDNRITNLREATRSQNMANQSIRIDNTSGFKGISFLKGPRRKPWYARINFNNENHILGYFATKEEAIAAYSEAAKRIHGEFAHIG
jgi:hypothetical protein